MISNPRTLTQGGLRAADAALSSAAGLRAPPQSPDAEAPPGDAELARAAPPRRAPQPFTMHKMAFHRGRVLGILRAALRASLPLDAAEVATAEVRRLDCLGLLRVLGFYSALCVLRAALRASLPLDAAEVATAEVRRLDCLGLLRVLCFHSALCVLRCALRASLRWPPRRCAQ